MRHLDKFEVYICAALFLGMTALGFANVIVRYLTSFSFAATQELLLSGFLLLTVFGAALAAREGDHLAVQVFTDLLPAWARRWAELFAACLSLTLLLLAAWYTYELVINQLRSGVVSSGLQVPGWYYSAGLPLGFLLIALRVLQRAIFEFRHPGRAAEVSDV